MDFTIRVVQEESRPKYQRMFRVQRTKGVLLIAAFAYFGPLTYYGIFT
jgi:hypothetical protein